MIEFSNANVCYKDVTILKNISLTIKDNEFLVLIGESGCGKTTLLKTINKLLPIHSGSLNINGKNVKKIPLQQLPKLVGYVVQSGGLFPHMTIEENIALTMEIAGIPKNKISEKINQMLQMVNLDPLVYRNKYPSQMSGGQQQRVGVARAFAAEPPIVLMDEPFSALDPVTRTELQNEIHELQKETKKTVVFVTHDMDEAIKLGDRICMIQNGSICQCDIPENILKHPANDYVRHFIGENRLWENPEYIRAKDIMKKRPFTIYPDRSILQARQTMSHAGVDSLLVTNHKKKLLGILRLEELRFEDSSKTVESCISDDFVCVKEDTSLKEIISTIDYDVSGVIPVVSQDGFLSGFLTKSSLLATMSRQFVSEEDSLAEGGI